MNKNLAIALVVGLLVLGGGYMFVKSSQSPANEAMNQTVLEGTDEVGDVDNGQDELNEADEAEEDEDALENEEEDEDEAMEANAKTFTLEASSFKYDVKEIRVKQGDKVKIVLNNKDGFHDWVIDEFEARTKQINAGQTDTVEFVANKKGTFEYYCSVGQHRANGMVGKLIVE